MRYRLQRHDGTDCSATMVPITVLRMVPIQRYRHTKLLNWKQITTIIPGTIQNKCCFLYHKVTKLKANHNYDKTLFEMSDAVSYITKLLNWKQITTCYQEVWTAQ